MASGAEFDFKKRIIKENKRLDPESQMSRSEINQQARKQTREHRDYTKNQIRKDQTPMSAKDVTELTPRETRQLNRDAKTDFTERSS